MSKHRRKAKRQLDLKLHFPADLEKLKSGKHPYYGFCSYLSRFSPESWEEQGLKSICYLLKFAYLSPGGFLSSVTDDRTKKPIKIYRGPNYPRSPSYTYQPTAIDPSSFSCSKEMKDKLVRASIIKCS